MNIRVCPALKVQTETRVGSGTLTARDGLIFCVGSRAETDLPGRNGTEIGRAYLLDFGLQLLVQVPEVPHDQLVLGAHHDPLHVDLIS